NKIKAVNTVVINNNRLIGYNTDYFGFIESLKINNINLQGKKTLIIGSGGAAKAVLYGVKDLGVDEIHMVLRKKESIKDHSIYISKFFSFEDELDLRDYDIVINCTPLGGANYMESCPIK
ncbi:MAG TPA: shikimate dehydrogenase, partial [Clostridium sp.]|nr:shikimate dehydrogenase [Clostridium sp.]